MKLILGSASPRRKALFELMKLDFSVIPADIPEPPPGNESPEYYAESLAELKAGHIAKNQSNAIITGADTIVILNNEILGKPGNYNEAASMLGKLSGQTHRVITAVCLIKTGESQNIIRKHSFHETTEVTFSPLSDEEIHGYIESGSPFDKAGGYGIQDDRGALFVSRIKGDYYNVVGFPLNRFYNEMKIFDPALFQNIF